MPDEALGEYLAIRGEKSVDVQVEDRVIQFVTYESVGGIPVEYLKDNGQLKKGVAIQEPFFEGQQIPFVL